MYRNYVPSSAPGLAVACASSAPLNALTIDVEDYYHVHNFSRFIQREDWDRHSSRVETNTHLILDLLDETGVKGTFFVLGWVAERFPGVVREIDRRGHEIASHGYGHQLIYAMDVGSFRQDLRRAVSFLSELIGKPIRGYRAPSFSITQKSLWALDVLIEEGITYDSSIFPIRHDFYGIREAPTFPHDIRRQTGTIREFPLSTVQFPLCGRTCSFPISGGGYLRFLPLSFILWGYRRLNGKFGQPGVLYFHPWELDPGQPRIRAGWKARFRHYHNLHKTAEKIRCLLGSLSFAPMGKVLGVL